MTDLDRLLELAREAADVNAFVAKRAVTSVMHRHRERVDREFKEACTPQAIIGLFERVKETERERDDLRREAEGLVRDREAYGSGDIHARLRAAEEVVEEARRHIGLFGSPDPLRDALRHYDEA